MKLNPFAKCFDYYGIYTGASGSVIGAYDFLSGSGTSLVYNILYPSGQHFSGSNFYGPIYPLVNVGRTGSNGYASGFSSYRIGYEVSGDFGCVIDFSFDNCGRSGVTTPIVLFSTTSGLSSGDTFYVGIDGMNQLFLSTSGFYKTLYHELRARNLAFVNLGNQSDVEFGIFDPFTNTMVSEQLVLPNTQRLLNNIYLGGLLSYRSTGVVGETGLSGRLYNSVLFNKPIGLLEGSGCFECMFAVNSGTGAAPVTTIQVPIITGYMFSGVNETYITGFSPITGQVLTSNNTILNLVFPSGLTGMRRGSEIATVLTGAVTVRVTGEPIWTFPKSSDYADFITYDIQFIVPLESGDILEVYTYSGFNPSVNHDIDGIEFPDNTSFTQLIGNGLVETRGVDYTIQGNNLISGFFEDDILSYDLLTGMSVVTAFSGWWARSKILFEGGSYYPSSAQFDETSAPNRIVISGINSQRIPTASDVYLNGQKLISGIHYKYIDDSVSGWYGGISGLNLAVLDPTYLPDFTGEFLYSGGGGPTGVISIEDSELTFLPNYGQFNRYYSGLVAATTIYSGVTGLSEQVWVNGIRQRHVFDYIKLTSCLLNTGDNSEPDVPFNFYDNGTGFFNIN